MQLQHQVVVGSQVVVERAYIEAVEENTDEEEEVGEASYDKRLLAGVDSGMLGVIETDKQIRAHAHQLPEEIHLEEVGGNHQTQHGHRKQAQVSVETLEALLIAFNLIVLVALGHITKRIDMNHKADSGDNDEHHHADRRKAETDVEGKQLAKLQPAIIEHGNGVVGASDGISSLYEEILVGGIYRHGEYAAQHDGADDTRYLLLHLHARKS